MHSASRKLMSCALAAIATVPVVAICCCQFACAPTVDHDNRMSSFRQHRTASMLSAGFQYLRGCVHCKEGSYSSVAIQVHSCQALNLEAAALLLEGMDESIESFAELYSGTGSKHALSGQAAPVCWHWCWCWVIILQWGQLPVDTGLFCLPTLAIFVWHLE